MIRTAVGDSVEPIYLHPEPKTFKDAVANLRAFSDEGRKERTLQHRPNAVAYTSAPRLRECFGWIKINGGELCNLDREIRPPKDVLDRIVREILPSEDYYAIVYGFIPEPQQPLDMDAIQTQLDFCWLAGFCLVPMEPENWKGSGVLIDMADIICPWHAGWFQARYRRLLAKELFIDRD
jgi:hypothetical protein